MLNDVERQSRQRGHDPEFSAVIIFETLQLDAFAFFPAVEPVGSAADDQTVAGVVVVEFFAAERSVVSMIKMPRQGRQGKGDVLHHEIRFAPDHFEFMVVEDVDAFDILIIAAEGGTVDFRIFDDVDIEFDIVRGDGAVFPGFAGDRIGEIMPEDIIAELDMDLFPVGRKTPRFGKHGGIFAVAGVAVIAFGQGIGHL